jgi:lysozyme family protein
MRGISLVDLIAVRSANADRWSHAKIARSGFDPVAWRPAAPTAKQRYLAVSARTGVPWLVIAVIHGRECSQNWAGALAQRDPRAKKSIHVPAGRGPFKSWRDAAVDVLVNCAPYAERSKDWSIGGILTQLSCVGPVARDGGDRGFGISSCHLDNAAIFSPLVVHSMPRSVLFLNCLSSPSSAFTFTSAKVIAAELPARVVQISRSLCPWVSTNRKRS